MNPDLKSALSAAWAWRFGHALLELERAYEASRERPDLERARVEKQWRDLEQKVGAGQASFIEEDEEGRIIIDYGDDAYTQLSELDSFLTLLRETFTIALFHLWERHILRIINLKSYNENEVFTFLEVAGLNPDKANLKSLRLAANVAKHSEGKSANELLSHQPDMFDVAEMDKWKALPSHEYLKISDVHVKRFFASVRSMRPELKTPWS